MKVYRRQTKINMYNDLRKTAAAKAYVKIKSINEDEEYVL